jgi:hypothetical protein
MKKYLSIVVALIIIASGTYYAFGRERAFTIGRVNQKIEKQPSSISGLNCDNAQRRPVAVMMPSDPEARPLSGIGAADLVIEMPVTPNGVTRFMGVFQCQTPKEIGSIRSAREDFIPLAAGFKSIYAHWGGEHGALDQLNKHITDNINALEFDGTIFYRKANIKRPHNGFTNLDLLFTQAKKFGYGFLDVFAGYPHTDAAPVKNISNVATSVTLSYPAPNNVSWAYDQKTNLYSRKRGGKVEIDKLTAKTVTAKVIAVMHTTSHILTKGDQYIVVNTTGEGSADVYQNGIRISGTWKKDPSPLDSKLFFYDSNGAEIKFAPGQIWIEIDPTWQS